MYRIGICDDGINVCSEIEEMILFYARQRNTRIETSIWYSGEGLCEYLRNESDLDILFLDIQLIKLTGIEVAEFIRNHLEDRNMQIVYISAESSYAQSLFKTQPLDFLVKPIMQTHINEVLDLAIKILNRNNEKFQYRFGKEYYCIPFNEILYFTSEGKKIYIVSFCGKRLFYGKIKDFISELPENFMAIHQSYVINKKHVAHYTYELVELVNGETLPVSKAHRKQVRANLLQGD